MVDTIVFPENVRVLAQWVFKHPILRDNYVLGGGSWLALRHPGRSRVSTDVDVFTPKEDISSHRAMMELVETCRREGIPFDILRRGEHFCQIFVGYPDPVVLIKVDIGKIWRPIKGTLDSDLGVIVMAPLDMVVEKFHCIKDRIEPADLHDLCLLHDEYRENFLRACGILKDTLELKDLVASIHQRLQVMGVSGSKEKMTPEQEEWVKQRIPAIVRDIVAVEKQQGGGS